MTGSRPVSVIEGGLISKKPTKQTKSKQTKKQKVTKTTTNLEPKRSIKNLETMPPNAIYRECGREKRGRGVIWEFRQEFTDGRVYPQGLTLFPQPRKGGAQPPVWSQSWHCHLA